jgi:hypothetical protein
MLPSCYAYASPNCVRLYPGGAKLDPIIASIVSALAAGALASAKKVAGHAVEDAYNAVKALVVRKIGGETAVKAVEEKPKSDAAKALLAEELKASAAVEDDALLAAIAKLQETINAMPKNDVEAAGIVIGDIQSGRDVTLRRLQSKAGIKLGAITANQDVILTDLTADGDPEKTARGGS